MIFKEINYFIHIIYYVVYHNKPPIFFIYYYSFEILKQTKNHIQQKTVHKSVLF